MSAKNVIQKLVESHLVEGQAVAGEQIGLSIDQTLLQDATGTMAFLELEAMGIPRVRTELSVQYIDHNTSQFGPENQNDHFYLQSVAAAKGVYFSRPGNGICHQVHLERFGAPGKTLLGADSHTPTNGGLGMLAIGAGGLDVACAMAGQPFSLVMPRTIGIRLTGQLSPWTAAKDVILYLLSQLGAKGNVGYALEYFGPGVETLTVPERSTITNMGAELGVTSSVFPSDETTRKFLKAEKRESQWRPLAADAGAEYDRIIEVDLSSLEPMVACPSSPGNVRPVKEVAGTPVNQVIIGSCTNSSLKDLITVADMFANSGRVAAGASVAVAPGSRQVLQILAENGRLANFISAGARILETACGPCIGQGQSPASDSVTVRTFNRNFPGRTGTAPDHCYLTSPETAAASALCGELTDPRSLQMAPPEPELPEEFRVDDGLIIDPPPPEQAPSIIRKETIGDPPYCAPMPADLDGCVLLALGDNITTDHIMPAGNFLKLRSNIAKYAEVVFNCFNESGQPTFAEQAAAVRDQGRQGVIVAGEGYGQGSSREHAAICPMYLGIRVVLALGVERIHRANLINFGILPLRFADTNDYQHIHKGDSVRIRGLHDNLRPGESLTAHVIPANDGEAWQIDCAHDLSAEDVRTVLAGGRLNMVE